MSPDANRTRIKDRINDMLEDFFGKLGDKFDKLSDKMRVIHNHGRFVYERADINNTKEVKEKFGHKPFEAMGICDNYKTAPGYTSWKETRPIYRLNSHDEVTLLGATVYSVLKGYDEYENHPAVYSFRGFITPAAYKKKEKQYKATLEKAKDAKAAQRKN